MNIQLDSLAQLPHPVLDLTPVVPLVGLLHGPQHQRAVGVELGLPAGCLDVVEDGGLFACRKEYSSRILLKIASRDFQGIFSRLLL